MSELAALKLVQDESVIRTWRGDSETSREIITPKSFGRKKVEVISDSKDGILVLTNHRLAWLQEHGRFGKSYHPTFWISLEQISGVSMGGSLAKFVAITDDAGPHVFHLKQVGGKEFPLFKQMVEFQKEQRLSSLKVVEESRQAVLVTCAYCGHRAPQGTPKCPECGARL